MSHKADLDLTAFLFGEEEAESASPQELLDQYRQSFNTAGEKELLAELDTLKKEVAKAKRQKASALKKGSSDLASKEEALSQLLAKEQVVLNHLQAIGVDPKASKKSTKAKKEASKESNTEASLLSGLMADDSADTDSKSSKKTSAKSKRESFLTLNMEELKKQAPITSSIFAAKVEEGEVDEEVDSILELDIEEIIAASQAQKEAQAAVATQDSVVETLKEKAAPAEGNSQEDMVAEKSIDNLDASNPESSGSESSGTEASGTESSAKKQPKGRKKKSTTPTLPPEHKEDLDELFADHDNSVFSLFGADVKSVTSPSTQSEASKKVDNPFKNKDRRGAFGSLELATQLSQDKEAQPNPFTAKSASTVEGTSSNKATSSSTSSAQPRITNLNLEALSFLDQPLEAISTSKSSPSEEDDSLPLSAEDRQAQAQQLRAYMQAQGLEVPPAAVASAAGSPAATTTANTASTSASAGTPPGETVSSSAVNNNSNNLFAQAGQEQKRTVYRPPGYTDSMLQSMKDPGIYIPYPPLYQYGEEGGPPIPDYPRVKVDPYAKKQRGARGFGLTAEEQANLPKANEHALRANYYELQTNAGMIEMGSGPGRGVLGNGNLAFQGMPPKESHPKTNWRDYFDYDIGPDRCLFMDDAGNPLFAENFEFNPSERLYPPFTGSRVNEVDATTAYPPGIEPIMVKPISVFSPASSYVPWSQELEDRYVEVVKIYDEVVAAREAEARAFASDEEQAALRLIEKTAREHREAEEAAYPLYDFKLDSPERLTKILESDVSEASIEEYKAAWEELDKLHVAQDKSFFDHERSREDRDKIVDLYVKSIKAIKAEENRPQVIIDPVMELLPERHYENGDEVVLALPVTPRMVVEYNLCRSRPDDHLRRAVVHRTFGKIHELRRKALEEIIVPFEKEDGTMEGEEGISNFEVDLYTQFPDLIPNYTDFPFSGPAYMQRLHSLGFELLFFDTETTGMNLTSPEKQIGHRVVTIGMVPFYKGRIAEEEALEFTFKPEREIEYAARKVHGIEDYMVKDHPPFAKYVNDIRRQFEGRVVIAHNANFDVTFIDQELEIAGADWRLRDICLVCDSLKLSKRMHDTTRHTLDALSEDYDVKIDRDLHGAKLDSVILAHVYVKMMELYMPNLFKLAGIEKKFRRPIYDLPYIEPNMENADVVSRRIQLSEKQWEDIVEFETYVLSQVEAHHDNIQARKNYAEEQAELAAQEKARLEEEARLAAEPEVEVETTLMPEEEALLKPKS